MTRNDITGDKINNNWLWWGQWLGGFFCGAAFVFAAIAVLAAWSRP